MEVLFEMDGDVSGSDDDEKEVEVDGDEGDADFSILAILSKNGDVLMPVPIGLFNMIMVWFLVALDVSDVVFDGVASKPKVIPEGVKVNDASDVLFGVMLFIGDIIATSFSNRIKRSILARPSFLVDACFLLDLLGVEKRKPLFLLGKGVDDKILEGTWSDDVLLLKEGDGVLWKARRLLLRCGVDWMLCLPNMVDLEMFVVLKSH